MQSTQIKVFEDDDRIGLQACVKVKSEVPVYFDSFQSGKNKFDAETLAKHLRRLADAIEIEIKGGKHHNDL